MRRDDGRLLLLDEDLRQRAGVGPDEQIVVAGIAHRERAPDEPLLRDDPRIAQRLLRSHDIIDRVEPVLQLRLFAGEVFDLGAAGGGLFGKRLHPGFHLRQFAAQTTDFALFGGQLGIEAANHLFESLDAQVGFAQLRRGALQRSDLLPVLLQQPVDRGDVGIDLLDRTAHPFVIARERDEVFARTDPRQILGDGIDVGEDDLDERILRTNHRFERIALHHGLFGHPAAHARYECTCGTEYRQANVFHHFRWFDCHNGVKDKQKSGRLYEKNAPAAASGIKIVRRMADSRRPACGIRLKSAIFGRRLRYSRSAMFE